MLQPALLLFIIQRAGEVAGAIAEQQLRDTLILKGQIQRRQVLRRRLAQDVHAGAIGVAEEAVIQLRIDILRRRERLRFGKQRYHIFPHFGMLAQQGQIRQTVLTIDTQSFGIFRAQCIGRGQDRALIDVHQLDRHRRQIAQIAVSRIQPLAQLIRRQRQQRRHVAGQIGHDQRVFVIRMPRQRHNPAGIAARRAEHAGNVHQRLHLRNINQRHQFLLVAMGKQKLKQLRLLLLYQLCHRQRGVHIGHRIVRLFVCHAVSLGEMLQLKARKTVVVLRPDDAFRSQRITGAHHVEQIPARIAVLPAPAIRVDKVAVEDIARHFVIEAHVVVTDHTGLRFAEQRVNALSKLHFRHAARVGHLRRDTGDHYRFRLRQVIVRELAVKHLRFAHGVKGFVGAQACKLRRTIQRRAFAEGFIIVEQKSELRGGHGVILAMENQRTE